MKKKINPSDLSLQPKKVGAAEPSSTNTNNCVEDTFLCDGVSKLCKETDFCEATYNCNVTLKACDTKTSCSLSRKCLMTYGNCETGNGCFQTGPCIEPTLWCQVNTEQEECLSELCTEKTVLCGEASVDHACLYTEQNECETTDALICDSTRKDCVIPDTEICGEPNTETICMLPETRQVYCTALPCQLSAECHSLATSCEETSNECES